MTSLGLGCPVFDSRESKNLSHNVHTASYSISTGLNGQSVKLTTYPELALVHSYTCVIVNWTVHSYSCVIMNWTVQSYSCVIVNWTVHSYSCVIMNWTVQSYSCVIVNWTVHSYSCVIMNWTVQNYSCVIVNWTVHSYNCVIVNWTVDSYSCVIVNWFYVIALCFRIHTDKTFKSSINKQYLFVLDAVLSFNYCHHQRRDFAQSLIICYNAINVSHIPMVLGHRGIYLSLPALRWRTAQC